MHSQQDDISVIQLVLRGQQAAFATLVDRYQSYVFTLAMRYVNNRELAEELSQDVFVKAYRCLSDFRGDSKFSTWLYTIVNSTCLTYMRKKKDPAISLEEAKITSLSDSTITEMPSERLQQKTQKLVIEQALNQLPEQEAQIISLYYIMEQSVDEVGKIMGLTASNVKVKLFRARQKLKEIIETRYTREVI